MGRGLYNLGLAMSYAHLARRALQFVTAEPYWSLRWWDRAAVHMARAFKEARLVPH